MNPYLTLEQLTGFFSLILRLLHPSVDSLGINDELKNKLQDVLIPDRLLTLGYMLGKGNNNNSNRTLNRECLPLVYKTIWL